MIISIIQLSSDMCKTQLEAWKASLLPKYQSCPGELTFSLNIKIVLIFPHTLLISPLLDVAGRCQAQHFSEGSIWTLFLPWQQPQCVCEITKEGTVMNGSQKK